jgi:hypothetical protein
MSHQEEENQVDYVADSEKDTEENEKEPTISCKNCYHRDVCYWYTQLFVLQDGMKQAKPPVKVALPFDASILAQQCNQFITKDGIGPREPEKTQDEAELAQEE